MTRRLLAIGLLVVCSFALMPVGAAGAASKAPKITKVSPLVVEIGRTVYVRGRNFAPGTRTTVVFQRKDSRSVFVRATRATRTKLAVRVPGRIQALLLRDAKGVSQPTKFRLRAVTRRAGPLTRDALSPLVKAQAGGAAPVNEADCDEDGTLNSTDADDDNDVLPDSLENGVGLDPCRADTDGDTMEDGFEYWSAKDLNHKALPYPGRKPYPNPLDANDFLIDFDGDSLYSIEEHKLWQRAGEGFDAGRAGAADLSSPLAYSDGTQTSRPDETPRVPAFRSAEYGRPFTPPAYPAAYDRRPDGLWSDDERDADADGLGNFMEAHGLAQQGWWRAKLSEDNVEPWPYYVQMTEDGPVEHGSYYGEFKQRPFADPDYVDPDSDGDTLLDAEDDQDDDDWSNLDEMQYGHQVMSRDDNGAPAMRRVNPFNPCAPDGVSRTCPLYRPFGGGGG